MPIPAALPKGSATIRGVSDIARHVSAGSVVQRANRLYMLIVKRESILNKRRSLEAQLAQIKDQLHAIEKDMRETEKKRFGPAGRRAKKRAGESDQSYDHGRRVKAVALKF